MKLAGAADCVAKGVEETLQYFHFPSEHWRSLRTNNPLERVMREIRRRTRAVGAAGPAADTGLRSPVVASPRRPVRVNAVVSSSVERACSSRTRRFTRIRTERCSSSREA